MGVLDNLGINLGYLLVQILGFIIIYLAVRGFALNPILNLLEQRKARISKGLEDARQAAVARDNADAEAKKVMDNARAEAAKARQEAATQAEETANSIKAQANEEAKGIISNARAEAEGERNRILSELRGQVAAISIAAATKLIGDAMDENRQRSLLANFFAKVPEDVSALDGDSAEVTSALPLTDEEIANVKKSVKAESINFKVDPNILGGLIVRVGDQIVDSSVAGQMEALRSSMQ